MVRIAACAYRDWGINIAYMAQLIPGTNVKVITKPDKLADDLDGINPDIVFFYGWSWKVPKTITDKYLCLCLHPSPLPKYRGGSPIQNQIINGEILSAVSIFRLTDDKDAGPLCYQQGFSLEGGIHNIFCRLKNIGYEATKEIVAQYPDIEYWEQEGEPTYFKRRKPEMSEITISELQTKSAEYLYNKIRMLQTPYPNAFITCGDGSKLYLTEAHCG